MPEAPTREDVQDLRQSIESLRDHVQIVWQAIDELREVIDHALGPDSPDIWTVEPPHGPPVGRYRPFAGEAPVNETDSPDGRNGTPVEPPPVRLTGVNSPQPGVIAPPATGRQQQRIWVDDDAAASEPSPNGDAKAGPVGSQVSPGAGVDTFEHQHRPYTLDDWRAFRDRFQLQQITAAELHDEFRRMQASKGQIVDALVRDHNADQLRLMAAQLGCAYARQNRKEENAQAVYQAHLKAFVLGQSVMYQPLAGETFDEALAKVVDAITDEDLDNHFARAEERKRECEEALRDPQSWEQFRIFIRERGIGGLSDEQFATWDRLNADRSCEARKRKQKETVEQFQSVEIDRVKFRIIEGFHEREQVPLWIVQLSSRVERGTFSELKVKATQLGGWWSSFKKDAAGFQFRSREAAEKFAGLADGDADRSEELLARKLLKMDSAADRLSAVAETLETKVAEVLAADDAKLKNTARRADMAASMRAQAYADHANAKTLRSIAAALAVGDAQYLDGVWNAAQVQTLAVILRDARRTRIGRLLEEEGTERRSHAWSLRYDELEAEPLSMADARSAEYPKPYLYRGHLEQAFAKLGATPGVKRATAKLRKVVDGQPKDREYLEFNDDYEIGLLEDFLVRAKAAGMKVWWFDHCLESYKRLKTANIHDAHELRCALRELVPHLAATAADDPVKRAEDDLRGKDLPGFFPTPRPVIDRMLELVDIQPADRVLEPSCGKGDILDAVRREHPDVDLVAVEQNLTLQGVLTAKGHDEIVTYGDFLEHQGRYDRILMNPPFERANDVDHIRKAYNLLASGGRLVSVVCEGPFFRSDAKSVAFREWLDEVAAAVELLPDDAFQGVEAFRQTGVKTRLVTIDKP